MIWSLILISYYALFVYGITENIRGPLFPEILRQFEVSDSIGSLMFAVSSLSGFISGHFARRLLRRYDRRTLLQCACLTLIVSLLGMAFAQSFAIFLFLSLVYGLSAGILSLIPNILVPLGSTAEKKQQLLSGLHAMYGIASFTAPLLVAAVSGASLGGAQANWRWIIGLAAVGPFSLYLYSLHPSHLPHHSKPLHSAEPQKHSRRNLKPQLYLALMLSFCVACENLLFSRLALYMQREWHYHVEQASLCVSGLFLGLLFGRLLFAAVKLKLSLPTQLSLFLLVTAIFLVLGLYVHPYFLMACGFGVGPFYPLSVSWISSQFSDQLDSALSYSMATNSLMLAFMHVLVGRLTDAWGIHQAMLSGLVFLFLSFVMVNTYERVFPSQNSPRV